MVARDVSIIEVIMEDIIDKDISTKIIVGSSKSLISHCRYKVSGSDLRGRMEGVNRVPRSASSAWGEHDLAPLGAEPSGC
ncbi:hypothetical protein N7453_010136 [Penicillium expansum]|nr:hypothetical protein N7453_010136 [Penicillium expansum]